MFQAYFLSTVVKPARLGHPRQWTNIWNALQTQVQGIELSFWKLPLQPVIRISSKCNIFVSLNLSPWCYLSSRRRHWWPRHPTWTPRLARRIVRRRWRLKGNTCMVKTLRCEQCGLQFTANILRCIFLGRHVCDLINFTKDYSCGPIDYKLAVYVPVLAGTCTVKIVVCERLFLTWLLIGWQKADS